MKKPDLFFEQIRLGEKPRDEVGANGTLAGETLPDTLDALRASDAEILSRYPAADMKLAVEARLQGSAERKPAARHGAIAFRLYRAMPVAAAACAVLLFSTVLITRESRSVVTGPDGIVPSTPASASAIPSGTAPVSADFPTAGATVREPDSALPADRSKGTGAKLFIYRKDGNAAVSLAPFSRAKSGDILQLSYLADGAAWGFIVSIDGRGIVTRHYPDQGSLSGPLEAGGEIPLEFSYQLDDAPGFERFIFISGREQFAVDGISAALARSGGSGSAETLQLEGLLPEGVAVTEILLLK